MAGVFQNDGEEGAWVRPKGYYWVRFRDGGWEPAEWDGEARQVIGIADVYQDDDIPEIGPPIEQPE
jgi:hypothetical protein